MNNKGTSLVEMIAIIVIMGIIATIATATTITVIDRQRKNSTVNALNNIYVTAKNILYQVQLDTYDSFIVKVDDDFCYVTLTTLVEEKAIDGDNFKPVGNEVLFCYDMDQTWVQIGEPVTKDKPSSTNDTQINKVNVTFDYSKDKFVKA